MHSVQINVIMFLSSTKSAECHRCGKKGHIRVVCHSKPKPAGRSYSVQQVLYSVSIGMSVGSLLSGSMKTINPLFPDDVISRHETACA